MEKEGRATDKENVKDTTEHGPTKTLHASFEERWEKCLIPPGTIRITRKQVKKLIFETECNTPMRYETKMTIRKDKDSWE